ncbi:hypothetical protein LC061_08200 [Nitratireductor aquimarinus]|uniref:hypothetical protein n=1 Tax=Nitratireductor TaxID=245876 RepID=UPI001CD5CD55|nr:MULTISPECIES: hypothetical protein [Nitratireductor]MCA1260756.1 hypothetical protein [Nitratireductor aquimarinus]
MDRTVPAGAALLLAFVYETETSRRPPECYEVIYAHRQDRLPKPLTRMTVDEVIAAQRSWSRHHGSSAAGAPQFIRKTLMGLKEELGLRGSQVFDSDLQDRLAYHLLIRRGYHQFINGEISRTEFGRRLAGEWASFPVLDATRGAKRHVRRGESYYVGDGLNNSLVSPEKVEAVLDQVLAAARNELPAVEKPVVKDPEHLDKPLTRSKTVWQWAITSIIVPVLAVFDDWRVQLAIVLIVAGFAVYAIKRRRDIAKVYRSMKAEMEREA